jgi:hypothetical protein
MKAKKVKKERVAEGERLKLNKYAFNCLSVYFSRGRGPRSAYVLGLVRRAC